MERIEDLFEHAVLRPYLPIFVDQGYDDLNFILDQTPDEWDQMLDVIQAAAAEQGLDLKAGLKARIITLLRKEKVKRANASEAQAAALAAPEISAPMGSAVSSSMRDMTSSDLVDPSVRGTHGTYRFHILLESLGCLRLHWFYLFALCCVFLVVGVLTLVLKRHVQPPTSKGDDQFDGAWDFVFALQVFAWTMAGIMFCLCLGSYTQNPDAPVTLPLPAFLRCESDESAVSCAACCSIVGAFLTPNCRCDFCDDFDDCCPRCDGPGGGLCTGQLPSCSCEDSCDCGFMELLPEATMPSFDCCPDCSNVAECCHKTIKILTCQCQIQV